MPLNFDTGPDDSEKIVQIVDRVLCEIPEYGERMDVHMDVSACHCNGTPLALDTLLAADRINFAHDVLGIRRHINRRTGTIGNCFVPRCAAKGGAK